MFQGGKVLAIVPARLGSKGIKDKNIVDLCGRPLLSWTVEAATQSAFIDDVAISSDSKKIISLAEKAGATINIIRPDRLSTDDASSVDVVLHALALYSDYTWYVLLQPTSPLRRGLHIQESFELLKNSVSQSLVSISESKSKPNHIFSLDSSSNAISPLLGWENLSLPRQALTNFYELNGAIYIGRSDLLKHTRQLVDENTIGYVMDKSVSLDIDDPQDLLAAEIIMKDKEL
jgi:CMP-N,N'-diacetyllegionaminic acid synthase|tara:strand:+ start:519 stop:1214 length:696 start_codon:yes stop_codon:yes gene_type:complete